MEGKSNFFVLLVVIAVLSLAVCGLIAFLLISSGNDPQNPAVKPAETVKVPLDSELTSIAVYDEDTVLNLKGQYGQKTDMIQVNAKLKIFKKAKVKDFKTPDEKVMAYLDDIKEEFATYFGKMSRDEAWLQSDIAKERAKKDLKEIINKLLVANEKEKDDIVYEVVFSKWLCP